VFYDRSIEGFIERHPELKRHLDGMWSSARAEAAASEQQLREMTMPEYVKVTNTREARRRVLQPYIEYLVPLAAGGEYPGAEMARLSRSLLK